MTKMGSNEIINVLRHLIGDVRPVGETNEDGERFDNLRIATNVMYYLIDEVGYVAQHKASESSSQKCSLLAKARLESAIEQIEGWIE